MARNQNKSVDATPVDVTPVDATQVDATQVDATPVDATPVDATQVDATQVDATQVDATASSDGATTATVYTNGVAVREYTVTDHGTEFAELAKTYVETRTEDFEIKFS